jgi:hypothetical protein
MVKQGSELLSGQQALSTLSNNGLCATYLVLIFAIASLLIALPRTLDRLSWLGLVSVAMICLAGMVAMAGAFPPRVRGPEAKVDVGAGANPTPDRQVQAFVSTNFYDAFLAITNPVFAYAGHFM